MHQKGPKNNGEGFNSFPAWYERGKSKYIIVTGSVLSGVGKGTFTAALATMLKFYNLEVSMIKFDGYLNVDAGTLNPYRHGEVFVLDDGTETDLDLGSYERALHRNLSNHNYLTGGKIFHRIIQKERKGEYLGRDVQFIPHVTGEIKNFVRECAMKDNARVLIVEVGGTVGDLENSYFLEAMRELKNEEGRENVVFVNVTYIIQPSSLGEQKSKAAQLGIQKLMSLGVQPDIIVCRAENEVSYGVKEKLSLVSNVNVYNIISMANTKNIYALPFYLEEQKMGNLLLGTWRIKPKRQSSFADKWRAMAMQYVSPKSEITVAITGKYTGVHDSYISIIKALEHAGAYLQCRVNLKWIETSDASTDWEIQETMKDVHGIIVPGGFGSRGTEGKMQFISYARRNKIPFLGLCYGLQLALIEFARSVLNLKNANTTENEPNTPFPVIDLLPEQRNIKDKGATMRLGAQEVLIRQGTKAEKLYKTSIIRERFRHRYEVNEQYIDKFEQAGVIFSGFSKGNDRIMQIIELPQEAHPFFMATQFHPEYLSRPLRPHPLFLDLVRAAMIKYSIGLE